MRRFTRFQRAPPSFFVFSSALTPPCALGLKPPSETETRLDSAHALNDKGIVCVFSADVFQGIGGARGGKGCGRLLCRCAARSDAKGGEQSGGDWAPFVCRLGLLDWDQRQRLKTSFEDVFLTCRLLPSPRVGSILPWFLLIHRARAALTHEEAQIGDVCVGILRQPELPS